MLCRYKECFINTASITMCGTTFEASINPFQSTGNGRGAYEALISQHAGKDKWIKILRDAKTYVNERKWDGTTSYLLQSHVEKCRECYVDIENASEHITEQIPNARTRLQSLSKSQPAFHLINWKWLKLLHKYWDRCSSLLNPKGSIPLFQS